MFLQIIKIAFKKLPTTGDQVIQGPGENAGVIDIGDNDAIVFKIESHNHPSYMSLTKERQLVLVVFLEMYLQWEQDPCSFKFYSFWIPEHPKLKVY